MAVIWPEMVAVLYTDDGGASMYAGWLSCAPSAMINFGQIVAAFLAEPIGKTKIQCITVLTVGGALLGGTVPRAIVIHSHSCIEQLSHQLLLTPKSGPQP